MYLQIVWKIITILLLVHSSFGSIANENQGQKKSSFTRYVEYAETPFNRPSYFSVPFRVPSNNNLQYISNEMFAHLIREHSRHQQRVKLMNQNRYSSQQNDQQLRLPLPTREPILKGVSHISELRQTPFQRFTHNSTAMTYEEKRRQWKEDLKKRLRSGKQPARTVNGQTPVGTAGRYYITFNPFSNAYQVSRRLPNYVRKEDLGPEVTPDALLSTPVPTTPSTSTTSTTTPTPIVIEQHATEIPNDVEQLVRIPSVPKPTKDNTPIRQILNLDYYDDEFESPEGEPEQELETTRIPLTTTTTRRPYTTTTRQPYTTTTTRRPYTTTTTRRPYTTPRPIRPSTTQYNPPIVYPPITTTQRPVYQPPTTIAPTQQRSSLFSSYEDEDEGAEEDDEDFLWFKPDSKKPVPRPAENDPFSIVVHNDDQ